VLQSVSRTAADVTDATHRAQAALVRQWLAALRDNEDLVSVGAYVKGANHVLDTALEHRPALESLLCQSADTSCRYPDALESLRVATEGATR